MRKKTTLLVLVTVAVAGLGFAGRAQAQEPAAPAPAAPHAVCPVHKGQGDGPGKQVVLTEEQHGKIDQLKMGHLKKMMPLRTDLQIKQMELAALWRADELNSKAIVAKVKEISGLRGQLELERVNHQLALYKVLTPEQRKMAHRFFGRFGGRGRRGMRRGHGMMDGPGMMEGPSMRGQGRGMMRGQGKGHGQGGCDGDCGCGSHPEPGGPK